MYLLTETGTTSIAEQLGLGSINLSQFATMYGEVAKWALPAIIGVIVVKKGYGMVKRAIKGI